MNDTLTPSRYKFSVDDYHKLIDAGVFDTSARIELIDGELIEMPPIGGPHAWAVVNLTMILARSIDDSVILWPQNPLTLRPYSEPEPDFMLIRRRPSGYHYEKPIESDALLVIEVSQSTLRFDRTVKKSLYARYRIPEYWIVNVNKEAVEIYTEPASDTYGMQRIAKKHETISPLKVPGLSVPLVDVFTPR